MMIDKENRIFMTIASELRKVFPDIYIIGNAGGFNYDYPRFPCVSIVKEDNTINSRFSTFTSMEKVVKETYSVEAYSNDENGDDVTKSIIQTVSNVMNELRYRRTMDSPAPNINSTIYRRIARYEANNITEEE